MVHSQISLENIKHLAKKDKDKGIHSQPVHVLSLDFETKKKF